MSGIVYCGGRAIDVEATVRTWRTQPKLSFPRLRMRQQTNAIVIHHTGGVGDAAQVHQTLLARGLSVHICVNADGLIVQYADCETRCAHAKEANATTIGIEVVNPATPESKGEPPRVVLIETIHDIAVKHTAFTLEQVRAVYALCQALCGAYKLPMVCPMDGAHVLATVMSDEQKASFRGITGHLHWSLQKTDPGLSVLEAIAARPNRIAINREVE